MFFLKRSLRSDEIPVLSEYKDKHDGGEKSKSKNNKLDGAIEACFAYAVVTPLIFISLCFIFTMVFIQNRNIIRTHDLYVSGFEDPKSFLCPNQGKNTRLVILVSSAPKNKERRNAIRNTWGSYSNRTDITIAFMIGKYTPNLTEVLSVEDAQYKDLIFAKFIDSFQNMTLKTLAMHEWVQNYCYKAYRFIKADDDTFLNVPAWLLFSKLNSATMTIWGNVYRNVTVMPEIMPTNKTKVNVYSGKFYPDYTAGYAYMMTMDCVQPIRERALTLPYLKKDDAFTTGITAEIIGAKRQDLKNFRAWNFEKFAVHTDEVLDQHNLWSLINTFNAKILDDIIKDKLMLNESK